MTPLALVGSPIVRAGEGDRPAPQAGLSVPDPASAGGVGRPTGNGGQPGESCAAVERVARRHLANPADGSRRQDALRREVQRALAACRHDESGG